MKHINSVAMPRVVNKDESVYSWRSLLVWTVIVKITLLLVIFIAAKLLHFWYDMYSHDFSYLPVVSWTPWLNFATWDARHYSYLVDNGYSSGLASDAFYPLYPFGVWLVKLIVQNTVLAGYIVSTFCSITMLYFLYHFVSKLYDEKVAFYSGMFLLAFPTSFFFSIMYSESSFLMVALGFFYFWQKDRYWLAALMAFLLPMARPLGILLIVPILVQPLWQRWKGKSIFRGNWSTTTLFVAACFLGFGTYLFSMYYFTGSLWAGFDAQRSFLAGFSLSNMLHPVDWLMRNFIDNTWVLHDYLHSSIDRIIFAGVLIALIALYKYEDITLWFYTAAMAIVPAFSGSFMSYSRYVLVLFPICILVARTLKGKTVYLLLPLFMLQVLFLIMYSLNFWVA